MSCFHPLTAYEKPVSYIDGNGDVFLAHQLKFYKGKGRSPISFDVRNDSLPWVKKLSIPCGQCLGCRLERARQWAIRIMCEKQCHDESCFITLTYDNKHLPANGSLVQRDVTLFIKRLRKWIDSIHPGKQVRYFYCGEYGTKTFRPHYHLILFGYSFLDIDPDNPRKFKYKEFYKNGKFGDKLWISSQLQSLWQKGYCPFGDVSFDSASYVARYILKKLNGDLAEEFYKGRTPEFICMSRMPGIGYEFITKYGTEIYSKDFLHLPGRELIKCRPPKYFDRKFADYHEFNRHEKDDFDFLTEYDSEYVLSENKKRDLLQVCKKKRRSMAEILSVDTDTLKAREQYVRHMTKLCNKREGDYDNVD